MPPGLRVVGGNAGKRMTEAEERAALARLGEGEGESELPPAPPTVNAMPEALAEWKRIMPELDALGMVTRADMAVIAAYCVAFARWIEAEQKIRETASLIRTSNGNIVQSPWVSIAHRSQELMLKFLAELGLSPVARTRLGAAGKQKRLSEKAKRYLA